MTTDHGIRLRDGRSLSYAQYGDPAGFPILSAHGGLACRLDVGSAASVAAQSGVRLIAPDRPGVGGSDPRPGRTILDWVSDVGELLDLLAIDRFAAMGWSLGGQYAAALGYAWSPRVTRVAIIAGALPLTEPGVFHELPTIDRVSPGCPSVHPGSPGNVSALWGSRRPLHRNCTADWPVATSVKPTARSCGPRVTTSSRACRGKLCDNHRAWSRSTGP